MNKTYYPRLDETLLSFTAENGLTVKIVPRPGFTRKIAYFVTDFGSVHTDFTLNGEAHQVPAGIAHFLEHKMFELPDRDVSAEFAALGANVNAFTSYDMTAYYFSCTEHFDESLRLLLEFVSTPYFPEESVQRELGIIDQEIGMNEDAPDVRVFENLVAGMYCNHPIRQPILGTRESLRQITSQLLHACHRAFYTPANMILCVVGDVDARQVLDAVDQVLGRQPVSAGQKLPFPAEPQGCADPKRQLSMEVSMPSFQLGFKCRHAGTGEDAIRQEILGEMAAEALFGEASQLFLSLYERGLIDGSFGGGYETVDGAALLTCGGDSNDPEAVRQALLEGVQTLLRQGIAEEDFLRMRRSAMGRRTRDLDSFDSTCFRLCAYHFSGFNYFRFPELYASITAQGVLDFLKDVIRPENCTLSVANPLS